MSNSRWALPESWEWTTAKNIALIVSGGTPKNSQDKQNYDPNGISWITPADLSKYTKSTIAKGRRSLSEFGFANSSAKILPKDTVLFSSRAPIGYCVLAENEISTNQGFKSFITYSGISPKYLRYYLLHSKEYIRSKASGTTFLELSSKRAKELAVPIPPSDEQERIVAVIDALVERSRKAKENLDAIANLLDAYRSAILDAAFRGGFSKIGENNQDVSLGTLLDEIKAERVKSASTEAQKSKIEFIYSQQETLEYSIPSNWKFLYLNKLVPHFTYGSSKKSQKTGDIPVLRMGNIQDNEISWDNLVYTSDKEEIEKYTLLENDVLFNRTNSPKLVGKSAIYRGNTPAIFAGYLIRVRPYGILNPEYLNYCLASPYAREYCWKVKSDGVSQSNINAQKLAAFKVPMCSIEEQGAVVETIKQHFERIRKIEEECIEANSKIIQLNEAIFDKAFTGKLIPQKPGDEPAGVLIERIINQKLDFADKFLVKKNKVKMPIKTKGKPMITLKNHH